MENILSPQEELNLVNDIIYYFGLNKDDILICYSHLSKFNDVYIEHNNIFSIKQYNGNTITDIYNYLKFSVMFHLPHQKDLINKMIFNYENYEIIKNKEQLDKQLTQKQDNKKKVSKI